MERSGSEVDFMLEWDSVFFFFFPFLLLPTGLGFDLILIVLGVAHTVIF